MPASNTGYLPVSLLHLHPPWNVLLPTRGDRGLKELRFCFVCFLYIFLLLLLFFVFYCLLFCLFVFFVCVFLGGIYNGHLWKIDLGVSALKRIPLYFKYVSSRYIK